MHCHNSRRSLKLVPIVGLTCFLASAAPVSAETFTVNSTADSVDAAPGNGVCATASGACTLRAAIQEANALEGADQIILPAGTYTLTIPGSGEDEAATGDLDIRSDLTILGAGPDLTIIDGNGLDRVFHVFPRTLTFTDISVVISNVTIQNGDCRPSNCQGGGILNHRSLNNDSGSPLTLTHVVVRNNASGVPGFSLGGGGVASLSNLTVTNSTIQNNTTLGAGGGINLFGCFTAATVTDSFISGNTAEVVGGGISIECSAITITNSIISDNRATFSAGGIDAGGTPLTLSDSTVSGNVAMNGGGGGIRARGTETIIRSTISGNRAEGTNFPNGGGIVVRGFDSLDIINSTISGNTAAGFGGGIAWHQGITTNLRHVTVARNGAGTAGGGLAAMIGHAIINIGNSIVAANSDLSGSSPDCGPAPGVELGEGLNSQGHNLIQNPTGCLVTGDNTGNIVGLDPRLEPLAFNGGPTLTHGLLPGSPAIDAGNNATCEPTDQRGVARPVGAACDMGAFEGALQRLSILTESPLLNQLGVFSSHAFQAAAGVAPYAWSVIDGPGPAGMTFSAGGILSGTPTEIGSVAFTVRVTDSVNATAEKTFVKEVFVTPPPQIRIDKFGTAAVLGREMHYFILARNVGNTVARDVEIAEFLDPWFHLFAVDPLPISVTETDLSVAPPPQDLPVGRSVVWRIPALFPGEFRVLRYSGMLNAHLPLGFEVHGQACPIIPGDLCSADFAIAMNTAGRLCGPACDGINLVGKLLLVPHAVELLTSHAPQELANAAIGLSAHVAWKSLDACALCLANNQGLSQLNYKTCAYLSGMNLGDCVTQRSIALGGKDPNEKVVIAPRFIQPDRTLVYPIHFENIGTFEARDVFVTDVLDPTLDPSTVRILTPGGTFNDAGRTVRWDLLGINLPPGQSDNVLLAVKPLAGLPSGTEIRNSAAIQFEVFGTITTNEVVNIIDTTPPTCDVAPLPGITRTPGFPISWSGSDAIGEIHSYTILASVDGGAFTPFVNGTTETSAVFTGEPRGTYGFICVATDTAGNVELQSLIAEATTTIATDSTPPVITLDVPAPNALGWHNIGVTVTWAIGDAESGIASSTGCDPVTLIADTAGTALTCSATNGAGLAASESVTIRIDQTPPTIIGLRSPDPNAYDWNNSPVTIRYECSDALSGLAAGSPPVPTIVSTQGAGQSVTGTCTDLAGNSAPLTVQDINIDMTLPHIAFSASSSTLWPPNGKLVANVFSGEMTDGLSGIDLGSASFRVIDEYGMVQPSGPITVMPDGSFSFTPMLQASRLGNDLDGRHYQVIVSVRDKSGNPASVSTVVTVPHDQGK